MPRANDPLLAPATRYPLPATRPFLPHLIEVAFRGNRNEFFLWESDPPPPLRAAVIVDADRGEDLGHVHAVGELAAKRSAGAPHGLGPDVLPEKRVLRLATPDETRRADELAGENETARRRAMERVKANGLVMKLSDAEWQWDRKKLTFYFTAEKRVDFRNLVRDLASMFRTRIELKQIGVRDEARRLDGVGRCGRRYCSASWLPELRPVNLGVAKDQRLSLNPSQISGACGRLMCCLRYEHEFYVQSRKRFPKEGKILVTSLGEEKVVANDIFNDRVTLRRPDGDARVVALADLKAEIAAHSAESGAHVADDAASDREHDAEEGDAETPAHDEENGERGPRGARPPRPAQRARDGSRSAGAPPAGDAGAPAGAGWLRSRSPLPQVAPVAEAPAVPVAPHAVVSPAASQPAALTPDAPSAATGIGDAATSGTLPAAAESGAAVPSADDQERRARRRRGRRGGRRGRGPVGGANGGGAQSPGDESGAASDDTDHGE